MNDAQSRGRISSLFNEHPALILTVIYVAASTVGMVYSWSYLRHFGINVFNYAQIGDFLLASLKEPFTWLLVILAIILILIDNASSRRYQSKGRLKWMRWYGSKTYRNVNYLVLICLILLFLHAYALEQANRTLAGKGEVVEVLLTDGSPKRLATLLGTTGQFIFLYDPAARRVDIHPNENVQTISLRVPAVEQAPQAVDSGNDFPTGQAQE